MPRGVGRGKPRLPRGCRTGRNRLAEFTGESLTAPLAQRPKTTLRSFLSLSALTLPVRSLHIADDGLPPRR
jgi:hypothetical protein